MKNLILNLIIFSIIGLFMVNGCKKSESPAGAESRGIFVLLPVKEDPTISFRIWFKTGAQNDPQGKEGLAQITAQMLTEGSTLNNTYEEILAKLYPMAATYANKVDKEMTVIYGRTHKDNLNDYYVLLIDAITKPAFKDEDFQRIKSNLVNYIEKELRYSSDEELGKATLYDFIFQGTPYGHLTYGTVESINSITLDDVRNFYKKYYTKDNLVIGIGGDYPGDLPGKTEKSLSVLPPGVVAQAPASQPQKINGLEVLMVEKPADATAISFGFPIDVHRGDDDFFALALFNSWFGEHRNSSSHLYNVLREKRGMNYGDYSYIEIFLQGGGLTVPEPNNARRQQIFEVWIRPVQNQNRHFALRAAMRELKNVVDNGLKQDEFELTKKFLYKYALFYAPTTMMKLGYELDTRFYGFNDGGDYIEYFRNKINSLTLAQVNAAIKKHLQYNNIKIAIVTRDAAKFKDDLVNNTVSPITYVTPVPDDILQEDKIIEAFPLNIKAENIKIVPVDEMFQK